MMSRKPSAAAMLLASVLGLSSLSLPLAAAPSAPSAARSGSFAYRLELLPERPVIGSILIVTVRVEGLSAASLATLDTSPGLRFGSSLVKPWNDASPGAAPGAAGSAEGDATGATGATGAAAATGADASAGQAKDSRGGTELRLELSVLAEGPWTIDRLVLEGREGRFSIGPIRIEAGYPGTRASAPPAWYWKAPDSAYRYSAVAVSLAGPEAAGRAGSAAVATPTGAALEAVEGSSRSWLLVPLSGGSVLLPETRVECGELSGKAQARRIEILPLPAEIESTRAQGEFSLGFEGPDGGKARPGDLLVFRLVLRGTGNLPAIRFPAISASLNGKALPASLWRESRTDSIAPTAWGYEGAAILELSMEAPGSGRLRLAPAAFPVLRPDGIIETLRADPVEVVIKAGGGSGKQDPFAALAPDLATSLASRDKALERLPRLVAAGRYDEALKNLASAPGQVREGGDGLVLAAVLSWAKGAKGEALASVYGMSRRSPGDLRLRTLAEAASAYVDAGPPLRDSLPPPPLFWGLASALGLAGLALSAFLAFGKRGMGPGLRPRWRPGRGLRPGQGGRPGREETGNHEEFEGAARPRRAEARPALLACAGFLLMAALASSCLALASGSERRREFAVVWADKALVVPSGLSEGSQPIRRGASAEVIGRAPGFIGLRFEDGVMGWVDEKSVYSY